MVQFQREVRKFVKAEEGATMVEYGLLVGLLSVAAIASIIAVGKFVNGAFDKVQQDMSGAGVPGGA
jgi:pilus assembly protein Flp/PilA